MRRPLIGYQSRAGRAGDRAATSTSGGGAVPQHSYASDVERVLGRVLELAAEHLQLDVAWVSEIEGDEYRVRTVAGDAASLGVAAGDRMALGDVYCGHVLDGTLPGAVPDLTRDPRTAGMHVTGDLGLGAYVGVPIRFVDGDLYGTLCCLHREPDPALGAKDVKFLELLASVAAEELERERRAIARRRERRERIGAAVRGECLHVVYQPIVDIVSERTVGLKALARFSGGPPSPATWFAQAAEVGLAEQLELAAIEDALGDLGALPDGAYLSVNASPRTAASPMLAELLDGAAAEHVQLELTEQSPVDDYDRLLEALAALRERGVRVAVDDAGAGYADLRHILRVAPDVIKLDMTLSRGIDADPARAALARSLVTFAGQVGAGLIAEGIETRAELDALAELGVRVVQGHLLARPGPLPGR